MTLDEFITELDTRGIRFRDQNRDWRTTDGDCPICALYHAMFPTRGRLSNAELGSAGRALGLTKKDISIVMDAADLISAPPFTDEAHEVRSRLLALKARG